jgi:hypothetical protein
VRLIFGMVIGASLTIGGAYIADAMTGAEVKPLVNAGILKNVTLCVCRMTALLLPG